MRARRRNRAAVSRVVTFGPALAIPPWGWSVLSEPLHFIGLGVMTVSGVLVIPGLIVLAVFLLPRGGPALVPRKWRKRYRRWLAYHGIPRGKRRFWQAPNLMRFALARRHWCGDSCREAGRGIPRERQRSSRISDFLRRVTYFADRDRCVYCRRHLFLERQADHYVPWSQGGLTTVWNLMTLCRDCNLAKSNYWRGVFYRPVEGYDNIGLAAAILAAERRHRYNPLRLTRAAWALGA